MRVLVLGGYGLIGSAVVRECLARGWTVIGAGRNPARGRASQPGADWIRLDLSRHCESADWEAALTGLDAVINCAGALQDGGGDDLEAVHHTGVNALLRACETHGVKHFVQISAVGAEADAVTAFMRTKAAGDDCVRASALNWSILKPGLVIAPQAWGGTALLRGLAGLPGIIPMMHSHAPVQTVSVSEVAIEAAECAAGRRPAGFEADLVETEGQSLSEVVMAIRHWLGFPPASILSLPGWIAGLTGAAGDIAAWLGWATPLRSTAMRTMSSGVTGDAAQWTAARGAPPSSLDETLAAAGADTQARRFARTYFVHPLVIAGLSVFWLVSGVVAIFSRDAAASILTARDVDATVAMTLTLGGAALDIALGIAVLIRRTSSLACLGMIGLTLAYALAASIVTPHLWADPMGVLVKMLPAALLALVGLALNGSER